MIFEKYRHRKNGKEIYARKVKYLDDIGLVARTLCNLSNIDPLEAYKDFFIVRDEITYLINENYFNYDKVND